MSKNNLSEQKNITGLSFKDLEVGQVGATEDFVFVEGEIGESNGWNRLVKWLRASFSSDSNRKGFLVFFLSLSKYLFSRLRVILVLMSVLADIFFTVFEEAKNSLVRKSFWGRGGFLFYASQAVLAVILIVIFVSYVYRNPAITSANEGNLDYVGVVEADLLTMNASLNTLIPQDRRRFGIDTYIVKGGDTVSKIAEYFEISSDTLLWANNMDDNDFIKPGDELQVPSANGVLVKVKSGDTVASLAKKYNGNDQAIVDMNWLDAPYELEIGQEIFVPDGAPPKPVVVVATARTTYTYKSNSSSYTPISVDSSVGKFLSWPVAGGRGMITQCYYGYHMGIDIADKSMPSLVAAAAGQVIYAGWSGGYGYSVQILHGNGYSTWYAHMSRIGVSSGQHVSKGQSIGQMGSTGRSTGPHVHFELRRGTAWGSNISPVPYMDRSMGYCW